MDDDISIPATLTSAMDGLAALVSEFMDHPDAMVSDKAALLLQCVDAVHRPGLRHLTALIRSAGLEGTACAQPEIRLLLDLYDLQDGGNVSRSEAVLEAVRPSIEARGGRVQVEAAQDGMVRIRLSCATTCRSTQSALKGIVEQALREGLPDFAGLQFTEPPLPANATSSDRRQSINFVPVSSLKLPRRPKLIWHEALRADDIGEGAVSGLVIDGESLIIAHVADEFYAYRNACPGTPLPLQSGRIVDGALQCPWHGCRFDLRGGRRVDASGPGLGVVPIALEDGKLRIGLPEGAGV